MTAIPRGMHRAVFGGLPAAVLAGLAFVAILAPLGCAPAHDAPTLYAELQDPDPEVRLDAQDKIARIVRSGDHRVFVRGLDSPVALHRVQSILYLADMPQEGARAALRELLSVDRRMMLPFNPIRLKPTSEEHDSRILVAHLIRGRGEDPKALPILLEGIDPSQEPDLVMGSCFAIGALGDPGGIPFLAAASRSPEVDVARAAVQALGQFREPEVLDALEHVLSHPSPEVRGDALTALETREGPAALDLMRRMALTDPAEQVRLVAIERVSQSSDPSITGFLIDLLRAEEMTVRVTAAEALARRTGQSFGEDADRWSRWWASQSPDKTPGR